MPPKPTGQIQCLKWLHAFGDVLLIMVSVCEIIVGSLIMAWLGKNLYAIGPGFIAIPSILLGLGFVGILVALLGFYGCGRENVCMLKTYTALVIILFITEVIIAIVTSVESNRIQSGVATSINMTVSDYFKSDVAKLKADEIQKTFACCGANSALDYPINKTPDTCCSQPPCNITDAYQKGCANEVSGYLQQKMLIMSITSFVACAAALLSAAFTCLYFRDLGQYTKL